MRPALSCDPGLNPVMRQPPEPPLGDNPLIELASPLLRLALHLRQACTPHAEAELYQLVSDEILALESSLVHQGFEQQTISDFRYLLCCVLDEAVMSQPWGSCGIWSSHSLLTRFHQQSWGGEQFFVRLQHFMNHPNQHRELLQFADLCLHLPLPAYQAFLHTPSGELFAQSFSFLSYAVRNYFAVLLTISLGWSFARQWAVPARFLH